MSKDNEGNKNGLKKVLITGAIFVPLMVALFLLFAPTLVEKIIMSQMRAAGLVNPHVSVLGINHKGLHLKNLSTQTPSLYIDFVSIAYSWQSLLQGKVNEIFITGLVYDLKYAEGQIETGLPDPAPEDPTLEKSFFLPFNTLQLNSSSLRFDYQGAVVSFPVDGTIATTDNHTVNLNARTEVAHVPIMINGQADINTLEADLAVQIFSRDLFDSEAFIEPDMFQAGFKLNGHLDADGRWKGKIQAGLQARNLDFTAGKTELGLEKGSFLVEAVIDDEFYFDVLDIDLRLYGLVVGEYMAEHIALAIAQQGAVLSAVCGISKPFKAHLNLNGEHGSINELFDSGFHGRYEWEAGLEAGQEFLSRFGPYAAGVSGNLEASLQGSFEGHYKGANFADPGWGVDVKLSRMDLKPIDINLPDYGLRISGLKISAPLEAKVGPDILKTQLGSHVFVDAQEIQLHQAYQDFTLGSMSFSVQGNALASQQEDGDAMIWDVTWELESTTGVQLDAHDIKGRMRSLNIAGNAFKKPHHALAVDAEVRAGIDELALSDYDIRLENIKAHIPVGLGDVHKRSGTFSAGNIIHAGMDWPGPAGHASVYDYELQASGNWEFLSTADMDFTLDLVAQPGKVMTGNVQATIPWFEFPDKALLDSLVPALKDYNITGQAMLEAAMILDGAQIKPYAVIMVRDASINNRHMDLDVSGIGGKVVIDDFFPLTTPGNQRIDINRLSMGQITLKNGFVVFRLESPERLFIEKSTWELLEGGFVATYASRFDLEAMSADFELIFEDIDLIKLIEDLSDQKVVGSGLVYGRVPLQYTDDRVTIGRGYLNSVPGKGRLGIRDEEWLDMLLGYVREAMAGHEYLSTVTQRLEMALRDFEYNFLTVGLIPGIIDTRARIELRGTGLKGDPPQEVGSLVINVNDLGEIVNRVLRFQLTKDESIERALDDLFDF